MKICKRRNLTQEEFRKWNDLYSCRKLERLIGLNFKANSFYYVLEVDTHGFNMDRDGILEDFKLAVIRTLRPLVTDFNYVYSINQNADGRFYVHLVTNATENVVSQVFSKCWLYGSLYSVQSVCNSSSALDIANAMTLDVFGTQGQRKKRMYVPSKGLVH